MRMPCTNLYVHLVWTTWDRLPLITSDVEARVFAAFHAKAQRLGCDILACGGTADHVHVLCKLHPTVAVADLVRHLKGATSHLVNHAVEPGGFFKWQGAYGAFTVNPDGVDAVSAYVRNQKARHQANDVNDALEQTHFSSAQLCEGKA